MNILSALNSIDFKIARDIVHLRGNLFDNFFFFITNLGSWYIVAGFFISASVIFWSYKKRNLIVPLSVSVLGSGIMTVIVKYFVNRTRPGPGISLYTEQLSSFPSAHASLIFAFWGFLVYCLWKLNLALKLKIILSLLFVFIILLVGFSRLYLGVHFLSDVVGGYLIGLMWVLISMHISKER